jgi:hypothetical protein
MTTITTAEWVKMKKAEVSLEESLLLSALADIKKYIASLEAVAEGQGLAALAEKVSLSAGASGPIGSCWEQAVAYASRIMAKGQLLGMLERLAEEA